MKKHLIAAGVVAAFAAPAMAQNVTVYGNIEMGPASTDSGTATTTVIANGVVNSSRLGFKGTEDLGGGLKAFFRLESSLNPETGSLGTSKKGSVVTSGSATTVNIGADGVFSRGAEVGLSGAFGTIKLGKFDMPNEGGEISHFGNVGLAATSGIFENDIEIGSDVSGAYAYTTPTINGVALTVAGTFSDQTDGSGQSDVSVGEYSAVGLAGKVGGVDFKLATGTKGSSTVDTRQSVGSVSYDFGMLKASLTMISNNMGSSADRDLLIMTAAMPLGNGLTAMGMYRKYKIDGDADKQTGYALGISKGLSKRTTAYAAYMGANASNGTSGGDITKATKPSQVYVGVNHSF